MSGQTITAIVDPRQRPVLNGTLADANPSLKASLSPQPGRFSGALGSAALRGYSAYDLAVQNGFTGSMQEWLSSLKGEDAVLPCFSASALTVQQPDAQPSVEVTSAEGSVQFQFTFPAGGPGLEDLAALKEELQKEIENAARRTSTVQYASAADLPAEGDACVSYLIQEGGIYRWDEDTNSYCRADSDYHEIRILNGNI